MKNLITGIRLKNTATYDATGVEFDDLKAVNYIYGENGSGKTTLTNFINDTMQYPKCELSWRNDSPLKALVYNKSFVEENFHPHARLKGIFTLGKESHDIRLNIKQSTEQINKLNEELGGLRNNLDQKVIDKNANEVDYENKCWALKQKYDETLKEAFRGYRSTKSNFKEKCKRESVNKSTAMAYDELKVWYDQVFSSSLEKVTLSFNSIDVDDVLATVDDPIIKERIIGKEDIDIARLITQLNISDWVRQGHQHLKKTNGICPFCQQTTTDDFEKKLDAYFDDSYNENLKRLNLVSIKYKDILDEVFRLIDLIVDSNCEYLDNSSVKNYRDQLNRIHESNLLRISQKSSEPSRSLPLSGVESEITAINELLLTANTKIKEHNDLVNNIENEKSKLIAAVWAFIAGENKNDHVAYVKAEFGFNKAIEGLQSNIQIKTKAKRTLEDEVAQLERQITSIKPSIDEMNALLKSFNFTNFKFAETEDQGDYRIIRSNGEDAKETLSEGERTFVTFLYFIKLLNGSTDASRITEDKIIVIDDPISSLDSNILFIVSTLVRRIIDDIRSGSEHIKQIILLTHNIYFHKEVSFNKGKNGKLKDETFWILRKMNNVSRVQKYNVNPIKTSYQLLWQELRQAENNSSTTVQNIIRRIFESYFKNFGGYKEEEIIDKFDGEDQITCRALVSWINDGSHFISDDLYMESGREMTEKYLSVFEDIFKVMGHEAHYQMMMNPAS
jgi:wobble nucleotide-excising tRNase